ncbi:MAG: hypothetical protein QOI01_6379 [Mycobacterium sp.]|nr:hypothetical protein [Mycobacterium sp.]
MVVVVATLGLSGAVDTAGGLGGTDALGAADTAGGWAAEELGAVRGGDAGDSATVEVDGTTDGTAGVDGGSVACGSSAATVEVVVAVVGLDGGELAGAVKVVGVVDGGVAGALEPSDAAVVDDVEESGGAVITVSGGTVAPEVSDVVVVSDVCDVWDVSVDSDVGASTTGTGSQVKGDDGRTGSGSPGGSVAAGFCSTTL